MSAASDCVDHDLLIQRLQLGFGLTGAVLEWICSFLQARKKTGPLQRSGIHGSAAGIRRSTKFRVGPTAVHLVHSRTESRDYPVWFLFPSVCR